MGCQNHPNYKGFRLTKRAKECEGCIKFYEENKAKGLKESRGGNKGADDTKENVVEVEVQDYKTNPQDMDGTSVTYKGVTKNKDIEDEGCDCTEIDEKTFDDVFEELGIDAEAEIVSGFDEDDEDDEFGDIDFEDI